MENLTPKLHIGDLVQTKSRIITFATDPTCNISPLVITDILIKGGSSPALIQGIEYRIEGSWIVEKRVIPWKDVQKVALQYLTKQVAKVADGGYLIEDQNNS